MTQPPLGLTLAAVAAGMVGVSFAAVPLYRMFCAVTGYDGTPQIGASAAPGATRQEIYRPLQRQYEPEPALALQPGQEQIRLPLGEEQLAFYTAQNLAGTPVTGVAALQRHAGDGRASISTRPPASASTSRRSPPASRCSSR